MVESFLTFTSGKKLYVWKKIPKKAVAEKEGEESDDLGLFVPKLSDSKLRDLTWSLGVSQNVDKVGAQRKTTAAKLPQNGVKRN